jgi:hypothetical protein
MPLNWSVKAVKNADDVCYYTATKNSINHGLTRGEEYVHPITNTLVFLTMAMGLNDITEENVDEWESRLALAYEVGWISKMVVYGGTDEDGTYKWEPRMISRADLERHIGLETNASYETNHAWRSRLYEEVEARGLKELGYADKDNVALDAITHKESLELRDAIRSGKTTKEREALPENQPAD